MPFRPRRVYRRVVRRARRSVRTRRSRRPLTVASRVPRTVAGYHKPSQVVRLRFALKDGDAHVLTSTAGALATPQKMRANDVYDPNQTGVGNQPRYFDQYQAMYRHFVVLGSKITTVWTFGQGSSTSHSMVVAITLKDNSTSMASKADIIEHPRNKHKILSAESDKIILVNKYSWRCNGQADPLDLRELWGSATSSPSQQWTYHLDTYGLSSATETAEVTGFIDYTVCFFQQIDPGQS